MWNWSARSLIAVSAERVAVNRILTRTTMQSLLRLLALSLVAFAASGIAYAQSKRPLAAEDLYLFDSPQSAVVSPDGKRAAYIRQWIDSTSKQERYSLWLVDGKPRALEASEPDARAPIFSPDGKWIAFLSTRARPEGWKQIPPTPLYSDSATDIWLLAADGGRALPLAGADKPYGRVFNDGFYGRVAFSPDGRRLVFVADDGKDLRTPQEIAADVIVVRPDQGEGYTGYGPAQIWVAHLDDNPTECAGAEIVEKVRQVRAGEKLQL